MDAPTVHPAPRSSAVQLFDPTLDASYAKQSTLVNIVEGGAAETAFCCCCCKRTTCFGSGCTPRRKARFIVATVVLVLLCLAGAGVGLYYGVFLKHTQSVPIRVSGLHSAAAISGRRRLLASAAVASATTTSYATVRVSGTVDLAAGLPAAQRLDALTLNVAEVRFAPVSGGDTNLVSTDWGASRTITLLPGTQTIPITETVPNMVSGPYNAADFVFWNKWSIKAFCQTANAFLYTTAAGVVSLPSAPTTLPSNYDAYTYDFMNGFPFVATTGSDTASNTAAQGHQSFINTVVDYNVDASSSVNLYVDSSYVVACYDGTANSSSWRGLIPPFGTPSQYGMATPSIPFDWSAPAFSLQNWNLPIFVEVSSTQNGTSVGETYAFADAAASLPRAGAPTDWSVVAIATLTWSGAGAGASLLDMRVRGSQDANTATDVGGLSRGGFFNLTQAGDGSWSAYNGQQMFMAYQMLAERQMSGFVRPAAGDYSTVKSLSVLNGPQCNTPPGGSGQPNPCATSPAVVYYVQLQRA